MVELLEHLPPLPWIILFSPFVAAVLISLFFLKAHKTAVAISVGAILISLAGSIALFVFHSHNHLLPAESSHPWISLPGLKVGFGYYLDAVTILMLLVVTVVATCVFVYSSSYMKGDKSYPRYFASLSLFAFSMLGIVLANNFLMLFIFWELVAASSYLLIGFWFEKPSAADAANKAFVVNRIGDFGLVLGILTVWVISGLGGQERTFAFSELAARLPDIVKSGFISKEMLFAAALLVFCGVAGKSAQFPLYIWLPDAMEGPTPVSALIHAATMVAAGVYLLARSFFLVSASPEALHFFAYIGILTAFLAAMLAVVQNDIKKILAYSTISQLGYMVMAVGLGSSTVAMFHLTTHAFFKALLFLGAGSMIHALHTQDIWEMGGLLKPMKITAVTFLIGTLALCGIYPLSGFFSKDEILALAYEHNRVIYVFALFTAGLTAFYMSRACWVAILGPSRAHKGHHHHAPHESPAAMTVPLLFLTVLTVLSGFIGIPEFITGHHGAHHLNMAVAITSSLFAIGGLALGTFLYARLRSKEDPVVHFLGAAHKLLVNKYYLDDFFAALADVWKKTAAEILLKFDLNVIMKKGVDGTARLVTGMGDTLRRAQTGYVQSYAMAFAFGVAALLFMFFLRG